MDLWSRRRRRSGRLAGALDGLAVKPELLSYEGTFGVGYGVAVFTATGSDESRRFPVVLQRRKPGQANAQDGAVHPCFPEEVQGKKRAVADYFHISPGKGASGDMSAFGAPQTKLEVLYDTELRQERIRRAEEANIQAGTLGEKEPSLKQATVTRIYHLSCLAFVLPKCSTERGFFQ